MASSIECEYCGAVMSDCFGRSEEHASDCPNYAHRC